jgi:hypothetical protein
MVGSHSVTAIRMDGRRPASNPSSASYAGYAPQVVQSLTFTDAEPDDKRYGAARNKDTVAGAGSSAEAPGRLQ